MNRAARNNHDHGHNRNKNVPQKEISPDPSLMNMDAVDISLNRTESMEREIDAFRMSEVSSRVSSIAPLNGLIRHTPKSPRSKGIYIYIYIYIYPIADEASEIREDHKEAEEVPVEEESFEGRQLGRKGFKGRREEGAGSNAVVMCQFCGLEMRARELPSHLAICPHAVIKCKHPSCNNFTKRRLLGEHQGSCTHRMVECRGCGAEVEFGELEEHEKKCPGREAIGAGAMQTEAKLMNGGVVGMGGGR